MKISLWLPAAAVCISLLSCNNKASEDKTSDENDSQSQVSEQNYQEENPNTQEEFEATENTRPYYSSKPDEKRMASDLVDRTIDEGTRDGYFSQDWTHQIGYGEVNNLEIINVITDDPELYMVDVNAAIKPKGASYYFDTTLKMVYVNTPSEGWVLENITSRDLKIVSNGAYDSSIDPYIYKNGLCDVFVIKNNSDSPLTVGGRYINSSNNIVKFSTVINPHKRDQVGFAGVTDFSIDFVIKDGF